MTRTYNVSVQGGTETLRSFMSVGLYDEEGAVKGYNYKRYNFRFKQEYKVAESFEKLMDEWDTLLRYKDLINREYWNSVYLELKNLSSKESLLKKEQKAHIVKKIMEHKKIQSAVMDLSIQEEKNKFVKMLLFFIKNKQYVIALGVMRLRITIGEKFHLLLNTIKRLGYKKGVGK